jgi:hypothetical protein
VLDKVEGVKELIRLRLALARQGVESLNWFGANGLTWGFIGCPA